MTQYRYILEKGNKKHPCPECGNKRFTRYVDISTGEYLPGQYGRCDREMKCGYHFNPYKDGFASRSPDGLPSLATSPAKPRIEPCDKHAFISIEALQETLCSYDKNQFIQNLAYNIPFTLEPQDLERVIEAYYIGTIKHGDMAGATCFPFIDELGRICAVQVKQFDEKNNTTRTSFLHSLLSQQHEKNNTHPTWLKQYKQKEKKVTCLFGAHLLARFHGNPVALVEAPKSAIYGALYFGLPQKSSDLLWLAVYNLSSLTLDKCWVLKGRRVILFPDLSKEGKAYDLWSSKASSLEEQIPGSRFIVSDLLEANASGADRESGLDLADYLIRLDWRFFREQGYREQPLFQSHLHSTHDQTGCNEQREALGTDYICDNKATDLGQAVCDWSSEIDKLASFFLNYNLPPGPLQLDPGTTIINPAQFVKAHLATLQTYNGKRIGEPLLDRLKRLINLLTLNPN